MGSWISKSSRHRIYARDGYCCVYCGVSSGEMTLALDHLLPKSRGGCNAASNLVTACFPCNGAKGDRTISEWSSSDDFADIWHLAEGGAFIRRFDQFSADQRGSK